MQNPYIFYEQEQTPTPFKSHQLPFLIVDEKSVGESHVSMKSSNRQFEGHWLQHLWLPFGGLGPVPGFLEDSQ